MPAGSKISIDQLSKGSGSFPAPENGMAPSTPQQSRRDAAPAEEDALDPSAPSMDLPVPASGGCYQRNCLKAVCLKAQPLCSSAALRSADQLLGMQGWTSGR